MMRPQPANAQSDTIKALGGELELVAHFPGGEIKIVNIGESAE